ncbi:hypothetical protein [Methylobacter sp.]|uniref:hypothetical protein n=1 Tax=Methylobacter sp. TaxID=2051955 RepID=UPI002FDE80FB
MVLAQVQAVLVQEIQAARAVLVQAARVVRLILCLMALAVVPMAIVYRDIMMPILLREHSVCPFLPRHRRQLVKLLRH